MNDLVKINKNMKIDHMFDIVDHLNDANTKNSN